MEQIGAAITDELRTIIEYHNCRVYLLQPNGTTLLPIAFRGELFNEYEEETLEELVTELGEGMTGWVAEHGSRCSHRTRRKSSSRSRSKAPTTSSNRCCWCRW